MLTHRFRHSVRFAWLVIVRYWSLTRSLPLYRATTTRSFCFRAICSNIFFAMASWQHSSEHGQRCTFLMYLYDACAYACVHHQFTKKTVQKSMEPQWFYDAFDDATASFELNAAAIWSMTMRLFELDWKCFDAIDWVSWFCFAINPIDCPQLQRNCCSELIQYNLCVFIIHVLWFKSRTERQSNNSTSESNAAEDEKKSTLIFFLYKRQKMKTGKTITIIPWIQQQTCSKLIKTKQIDTFLHEIKLQIDWYTHTNTRIHNNSNKKNRGNLPVLSWITISNEML